MAKQLVTYLLLIIALPLQQLRANTDLQFNELMPSNIDCYYTEHDFPDSWIELYNPTEAAIDIYGYKLKESYSGLSFTFTTHKQVAANGFLIIPCDKKSTGLHTSFHLESVNGGTLYLTNADGQQADQLDYPPMMAPNLAYGREKDGKEEWGWELLPTPGHKNKGGLSDILLPNPEFSQTGRIMDGPTILHITMPEGSYPSDTRLYVTTDGLEPTTQSPKGYEFTLEITTTTVIRAKLISEQALSPRSVTQSYIFHPRSTNLPIVSIVSDADYFYSDAMGILSSAKTGGKSNYSYDWRRPLNIEYFASYASPGWFNQVGEAAISGMKSRDENQKSLKVYAHKRFGNKRFDGVLWPDKPQVEGAKSFILRNGGGNSSSSRINDAVVQKLFGNHLSNLDYQEYRPVIVYINGEYRGEFGLRERSNKDYVEANYHGLEDIETATQDSYLPSSTERKNTSFGELYDLYQSKSATYADLSKLIDVENFMNTMIAEMYATNHDYPHNNISIWRPNTAEGKWRWILKDLDFFSWFSSTPVTFDMFKYLIGPVANSDFEYSYAKRANTIQCAKIYQKMMSFDEFRNPFIDAFSTYLGDFLKPTVASRLVERLSQEIEDEIYDTYTLYDYNPAEFAYRIRHLRQRCEQRPMIIYRQMADFFSLGTVIPMTLASNQADVRINGIRLTEGDFDGAYFSHRKLRLSSGAQNIGWQMESFHRNSKGEMKRNEPILKFDKPEVDILLNDYPQCDSVAFSTYSFAESEFDRRIRTLGIVPDNCRDWSDEQLIRIDEPQCAYANISGIDRLPDSKDDVLQARIQFYDAQGNRFSKRALISLQGGDDANLFKKNLAVAFCDDEWLGDLTPDIAFGDWVIQDEFHLKAFYNDHFRGIPAIAYKLYNQMALSLGEQPYAWQRGITDVAREDPELKVYDEARCFPDAFPCVIYVNGSYYGTYAWQLKKHRRNMNQTKNVATHIHLDGTLNDKRLFRGDIDWQKFEIRNPKDLYYMDGSDYDGDRPDEIMDESSPAFSGKKKQVRTAEVKRFIAALSRYYDDIESMREAGRDEASIKEAIAQRFDVSGMIDYMLFSLVTSNYDGFSKNWQWFTYDGQRWFVAPYDLDLTFGYNEDALELWPASQSSRKYDYRMENVDSSGPMLWVKTYYWTELCERYAELRNNGIFSAENILSIVDDWYGRIGSENYDAEWLRWPESPCLTAYSDSRERIGQWIADRLELEDAYLLSTTESETVCPDIFESVNDQPGQSMKVYNLWGQPQQAGTQGFRIRRTEGRRNKITYQPTTVNE